jgi:glycosyltransferase involved in cell wall biosynthesis
MLVGCRPSVGPGRDAVASAAATFRYPPVFVRVLHYPHNRYLAVVSAYNEQDSIVGVIQALREHASDFDILVVDDGSTDETLHLAEAAGARVLRLPYNLGIGGALQAGFAFALEHGYDRMVQVDGDGQHDPPEIHRLMRTMEDDRSIDVVCGSRFLLLLHFSATMSRLSDQSKMITRRHGILEQRVRERAGAHQRLPASREGEEASLAGWGR